MVDDDCAVLLLLDTTSIAATHHHQQQQQQQQQLHTLQCSKMKETKKKRRCLRKGTSKISFLYKISLALILSSSSPLKLNLIPTAHAWSFFYDDLISKSPASTSSASSASSASSTSDPIALVEATKEMFAKSNRDNNQLNMMFINPFLTTVYPKMPRFVTETLPIFLKNILLYKPPVGITAMYVFARLALSKRSSKLVSSLLLNEEQEQKQMERLTKLRKKRIGRSLELDEADGKLLIGLGGVENVRTELCLAAIEDYIISTPPPPQTHQPPTSTNSNNDNTPNLKDVVLDLNNLSSPQTLSYYATAAKEALQINAAPKSSREDFVERSIEPLSKLQHLHDIRAQYPLNKLRSINSTTTNTPGINNDVDIIWMASKVAEVRTTDALLRTLRDRLVLSAVRLSRKEKYRVWRLKWYDTGYIGVFKWMRRQVKNKTIEDDRRNLQLTRAALKREMERLGQVQQLLLNRPCELSETRLLSSVKDTVDDVGNIDQSTVMQHTADSGVKSFSGGRIDGAGACRALIRSECSNRSNIKQSNNNLLGSWTSEAHEWLMQGREVICDLVTETISDAFNPKSNLSMDRESTVETDLAILYQWSKRQKNDHEGWNTVLVLIDNLSKARLLREHKYLPTAVDLKYWFKRVDVFGIPSSLATVSVALAVHKGVEPYWTGIIGTAKIVGETAWGVIEFRFLTPLKDIILDLLNRRPKLLDPFQLVNEEISLDNMLRDLGLGDGTKRGRPEALAEASRMYEREMAQGTIKKLLRGEMVRLLLIQVQQLKTGLLQAMGSIDDLVESNRLNVQLLATIPAILLVTFGTKIFFTAMYSFRSRDIVGLPSAHAEMKDLLMKMERCLLLSSHSLDNEEMGSADNQMLIDRSTFMLPNELGEFVLYIHSYLVILDLTSPPFNSKACDSIHSSIQELLMQGQLSTKRQIALLQVRSEIIYHCSQLFQSIINNFLHFLFQLISSKHDDLLKK